MEKPLELIFSDQPFEEKVLHVFEYQLEHNPVYRRYCEALFCHSELVSESQQEAVKRQEILKQVQDYNKVDLSKIPLLPIRAFKDAEVTTQPGEEHELVFQSSGTSGMERSVHKVYRQEFYRQSLLNGFHHFYEPDDAVILAYTPGYAENPQSSLIWMLKELIGQDASGQSRFLSLDEPLKQPEVDAISESGRQLILFGAAFGLVDLAENSSVSLPANSIVIETGGMKTHRREMGREELHRKLAKEFDLPVERVHSEYGMAELLSQAYATGSPWFRTPPWMQVTVRDPDDPRKIQPPFREGLIGVIDLANFYSCSFLLTGDRGMADRDGRFQVLGRWNPKDLRGCNFLIEED